MASSLSNSISTNVDGLASIFALSDRVAVFFSFESEEKMKSAASKIEKLGKQLDFIGSRLTYQEAKHSCVYATTLFCSIKSTENLIQHICNLAPKGTSMRDVPIVQINFSQVELSIFPNKCGR